MKLRIQKLINMEVSQGEVIISRDHFRKLGAMYSVAGINIETFPNSTLEVGEGTSKIVLPVIPAYHHALGGMHGCIYFKLLDDASYFAAASIEFDFFLLTKSFSIQFLRPFSEGLVHAEGKFLGEQGKDYIAEASLFCESGKVLAKGTGTFAKSSTRLIEVLAYSNS